MKGRKPKPTALKKLAGNPGRRPLNDKEPKIRKGKPRCPSHLNDYAKTEWRRIASDLYEAGLLTYIDRAMLASYCQSWGRWVEAELKLEEMEEQFKIGQVLKTSNDNYVQNAWLGIANRAQDKMNKIAVEFGMSPSSRSRVTVEIGGKEISLAELLFESASSD